MSNPSFASLTGSMLARKGEAKPSGEPRFGSMPWQPPVKPAPKVASPITTASDDEIATAATPQPAPPTAIGADPATVRVRLQDTPVWPARKPTHGADSSAGNDGVANDSAGNDGAGWIASKPRAQPPLDNPSVGYKTTIRLTHAQARAVKLAALVLDRPQQEILTAGLLDRLEKLACQDMAKCSCFQAVLEGLKTPG
jgi:hypothetical protein